MTGQEWFFFVILPIFVGIAGVAYGEYFRRGQARARDAEELLRALVGMFEVNIPDHGLFKGRNKMVLWHIFGLNSEQRMGLKVAGNSYEEACLNHFWGLLNEARKLLGIPETKSPESEAVLVQTVPKQ